MKISLIVWPMAFTIVIVVEYLLQVWHDLLFKELWVVRVSRSWWGSIWCSRQAIRFFKRQVSGFGEGHYCNKQGAEAPGSFSRAKVCGEREGSIQTLNLQHLIYYDSHVFLFLIVFAEPVCLIMSSKAGCLSGFSIWSCKIYEQRLKLCRCGGLAQLFHVEDALVSIK